MLEKLGISGGLLLSQIVNFVLLMIILRQLLYDPILQMLEKRKQNIAQSQKDSERARTAAQEAEQDKAAVLDTARREAQEIRAQATRDAEKIAQEVRARAEQEATEIRMKAQGDGQAQADAVLVDANKQIVDLTIMATEQLLGRQLDNRSDQERFVTEFLETHTSGNGA